MRALRPRIVLAGLAIGASLACGRLAAQPLPEDMIPWPFAPLLGMGRYEIAEDTVVQSLGYAPRWRFRDAELDGNGRRRAGLELRMPIMVSTYRTELTDLSSLTLDDIGTFAAVPGIEIDVPVSPRVSVKPLVYAGLGNEFHGGPTAAIYWAGAKTRASFAAGELGIDLVAGLRYAGFATSDDGSGDVVPLRKGIELTRPMRDTKLGGDPLNWYWHVAHTHYLDDDAGPGSAAARIAVDDEWELGIAFGKRDRPLSLGPLRWDRVGVALTLDSSGSPSGFRLVFRSLYDR